MRNILSLACLLALLLPLTLSAQVIPPGPGNATAIDTLSITTTWTHVDPVFGKTTKTKASWEGIVWRTQSGATQYTINPASISFEDSANVVDSLSASWIFARIEAATAVRAGELGYAPIGCSATPTASIFTSAGVYRSGTGSSTTFSVCGDGYSRRNFSLCDDTGSVVATYRSGATDTPGSGCEPTFDTSNGGGGLN
jgi:hypothetical protein